MPYFLFLSFSGEPVDYTLQFATQFDDYATTVPCGTAGHRQGLTAAFSETVLLSIPYNKFTEVEMYVGNNFGQGTNLCNTFSQVKMQIIATCEMLTSFAQVYQYGVKCDKSANLLSVSYNAAERVYAANSTYPFDVSFSGPTDGSRRLMADTSRLSHLSGGYEEGSLSPSHDLVEMMDTQLRQFQTM